MKLLLIHSDYIEYEAREETPVAEPQEQIEEHARLEEALTAFIAVEASDTEDLTGIVESAEHEIREVAEELGVDRVMLYPYAHLSQDLADPDTAVEALQELQSAIADYEVKRAPFGWYKSFKLSCKGHPLSELSREIEPREIEADEPEEPSEYVVLTPEGDEQPAEDYRGEARTELQQLIDDEVGDAPEAEGESAHIGLMQEKEFVGYDDLSDPGNFRWYPRGKQVRDLLIDYIDELVVDYGGMPVETPIMYDLGERCIREHSDKFGERQYRFESGNRHMMLRFAACFGQFSIMRDMYITQNDLPLRVYEMSTYSFRREQRGELTGLKRLRAFTMPDMHTACRDLKEAKEEFRQQAVLGYRTGEDLGLDYVAALRTTREFYRENKEWFEDVVGEIGEPVLVEVIPSRKHYWSVKIDLAVIDADGKPMENPTVQIDVESADRFDISYYDRDTEKQPILLHYSPSGSIERMFAALLETAATQDTPSLPVWLAPTQVRFVPVGDEHVDYCGELADELETRDVRVDIDDRSESVGKRIRRAEQDWVPYVAVVGDDEVGGDTLSVRVREEDEDVEMTVMELGEEVDSRIGGMPREDRYMPRLLSRHPQFE